MKIKSNQYRKKINWRLFMFFKYYDINSEMKLNYLELLKQKNGIDEKYIKKI